MPRAAIGRCRRVGWRMSRLRTHPCVRNLMAALPPESTPLNQHSLPALEAWLQQLGAVRMDDNPCQWMLQRSEWRALLQLVPCLQRVFIEACLCGQLAWHFEFGTMLLGKRVFE